MLAASLTYLPQPTNGGTVRTNAYNQIPTTRKAAFFRERPWILKGRDTIKYLSNAKTVNVVIDAIPANKKIFLYYIFP